MDNKLKLIELAKKAGFSEDVILSMEKDLEISKEKPSKDESIMEDKSVITDELDMEYGWCSMDEKKPTMSAQDMIRKAKDTGMTVMFVKR